MFAWSARSQKIKKNSKIAKMTQAESGIEFGNTLMLLGLSAVTTCLAEGKSEEKQEFLTISGELLFDLQEARVQISHQGY
jgi:hypothetical protein